MIKSGITIKKRSCNKVTLLFVIFFSSFCLLHSQDKNQQEKKEAPEKTQRVLFDLDFDAYYSSTSLIFNLTDKPIPDAGEKSEYKVYRDLLFSSYIPRTALIEASVYPMPDLGLAIKEYSPGAYAKAQISDNLNIVKASTAGFEEPFALALFLGNVVSFSKPGEERKGGNLGYMGYLLSAGTYHIKDNELVKDNWYEIEWKIIGKRRFEEHVLSWSFRIGFKFHMNDEITDVFYFSLRRSLIDFTTTSFSILKNSGFEYIMDVDYKRRSWVKHYFYIDKKWPVKQFFAFTLAVGFIWESFTKYRGSLKSATNQDNFQFIIRPNVEF